MTSEVVMGGEVMSAALEVNEEARSGGTVDMTDTVADEAGVSDTEPDLTLLDMPDDESNPCWMNKIE